MRIAAISDAHGNLLALDAALADIATQSVDVVVDLGDLLSGVVQPGKTADRLMDLDLPTLRAITRASCSHTRRSAWGCPTGWPTTPSPTGSGSGWSAFP
jgi:hypothetical protein